jgi:hypothetical protein
MTNGAEIVSTMRKAIKKNIYIWKNKEKETQEEIYSFISVGTYLVQNRYKNSFAYKII